MRKKTVYGGNAKNVLKLIVPSWAVAFALVVLILAACSKKQPAKLPIVGSTEVGVLLKGTGSPTPPEKFDITTPQERSAARKTDSSKTSVELGETIASLGNPVETGFWLRTNLVNSITNGNLLDQASGKSVNVTLIPDESSGTGGQISISALRFLGIPLTALPKLTVFKLIN